MTVREEISLIIYVDPEAGGPEAFIHSREELANTFLEVCWLIPARMKKTWAEEPGICLEYEAGAGKAEALNGAVQACSGNWIFYLEWDEQYSPKQFSELSLSSRPAAYAIKIIQSHSAALGKVNYQVRLFPNPGKTEDPVFQGTAFPDIYPCFENKKWDFSFSPLEIQKAQPVYGEAKCTIEYELITDNPLSSFIRGLWDAENNNFKQAGHHFKEAVESGALFLFDELAAYNGLGEVLCRQDRWFDAARYVQKSIDICPSQRTPYLLMYKISSYKHNWEKAYEYLCLYLRYTTHMTRANLDVHLPEDELKLLMGETLFKLDRIEEAFEYYTQFYRQRGGDINPVILERLLIYAIEKENFEEATQYLGNLFNPYLPDKLDQVMEIKLHEVLSMFLDKGWHEFVINLYKRLYEAGQTESLLLRRIAALIKAGQVDAARQLVAREGVQFDMWAGGR